MFCENIINLRRIICLSFCRPVEQNTKYVDIGDHKFDIMRIMRRISIEKYTECLVLFSNPLRLATNYPAVPLINFLISLVLLS